MLVDVHCHIQDYEDLDDVVKECDVIINNGSSRESLKQSLAVSKKYKNVKVALGVLSCEIPDWSQKDFDWLAKQKMIAVGEIGMDGTYPGLDKQEKWFRKFLELALKKDLPVIVHTRKAEKRVIEVLEEMKMKKVVLHCFCGGYKLIDRCLDNKWYFSIPTSVVYSKQFQEMVKRVPLTRILTESDAPFLAPVKGEKNKPGNVKLAVEKIAEIKGITAKECANAIFANYQGLF
tara:strand:+ start:1084 stop:1782 length:699 start_codon:yes stop_codon:yes gene_type:complete